ncbi:MAG: hypothetical protein H7Y32_15770 [Chloroflexales bacterium]|nr:hypothetical protein [Chloroflexales bacterium]
MVRTSTIWTLMFSATIVIVALLAGSSFGTRPNTIIFKGTLTHMWLGQVDGRCDVSFQPFDAAQNGKPSGAALVVSAVQVQQGTITFPLSADALVPAQRPAPTWLAVAVRCGSDSGSFRSLAPRLQHQAVLDAATAGLLVPTSVALICALPSSPDAQAPPLPNHSAPTLEGVEYRLEGGFWNS